MIIAQISDTHIDLGGPRDTDRRRDLERCVAAINALDPLPDAALHTGDMTHNGKPAEYEVAKEILGALRCPLHVAAGNRDDRGAIRAAFPDERYRLSERPFVQYSVEAYPLRLIALDTLSEDSNKGDFCQVRADSLRATLAEEPTRPTLVFLHHPPFEVVDSKYPIQFGDWASVGRLERALEGQAQVVGLLCGHTHRDTGGEVGAVKVRSMPSVAVDLRLGDYEAGLETTPLFKVHRFDPSDGLAGQLRAA